jgi:inward rectifier potassium channel
MALQFMPHMPDDDDSASELSGRVLEDLYHYLLTASWPMLIFLITGFFVLANLLFAIGYYWDGGVEGTRYGSFAGSFADMFFFSVQTMATIGYGQLHPVTLFSNILVSIEALFGLLGLAMMTGLTFSKFSRPTARVRFTRYAVIGPRDGKTSLLIRMANMRANRIVEAQIHLVFSRMEVTLEGDSIRRFYELPTTRSRSPLFMLSWTAVHPITEDSPFFGQSRESMAHCSPELVVSITGLEQTFSQTVHARHLYKIEEIVWGGRMYDVLKTAPDGTQSVDYTHFDDIEMLTPVQ